MEREKWAIHSDLIWNIAQRVQALVPGSIKWTARQHVNGAYAEGDADLYGFAIGKGFTSITIGEAQNADDAIIRRLATEIMGYEPGSKQDLERRELEADEAIARLWAQHKQIEIDLAYWRGVKSKLLDKIVALEKSSD